MTSGKWIIMGLCIFVFVSCVDAQVSCLQGNKLSTADIDKFIRFKMDSLKIPGAQVAIIDNGKIVYEKSYGYANREKKEPVTGETIFETASMSKPVFAWFVLKMIQDGILKMDLDTPLYKYMPYPDIAYDDRYKLITARMVLTHRSGFPNWRKNNKLEILFTPGTRYSYSGEGYEYLVNVVATLTHTSSKSLDSMLTEKVSKPLGLAHFNYTDNEYLNAHKAWAYYSNDTVGQFKPVPKWFGASYTLHTDAHDYAKFLIGVMDGRGLNAENVDSLLQPRVRITENDTASINDYGLPMYYGYGFVIDSSASGMRYQHAGNNGNFTGGFMFSRNKKIGYVILTNGDKGVLLDLDLARIFTEGKL